MRWFGTNGIREVVGGALTPGFATTFARALGSTFPPGRPIAVGWDGRTSSLPLARIVEGTLVLAGHHVIRLGLLATPAIQYSVPRVGAQLGVIVTASHNPPEFNGFKCIGSDGLEVPREVEESIESAMGSGPCGSARFDELGSSVRDALGGPRYVEGILAIVDRPAIARRGFTVVLDCANGASVATSPELLRRLGCRTVTLNGHLDGTFPGRRSEPTETNLADLRRVVPAVGADLGIAHDGDADRAIFVDSSGRYLPGEKILALLGRDRVRRQGGGVVVTPVSGTRALEDAIRPLGGEVVYTRVGSPSVTREMQRRSAVFGGEENGGLVFPEFQLARDGAMTAAAMLDYLARTSLSISEAVADLPEYTMVKLKVDCPTDRSSAVLKALADAYQTQRAELVLIDGIKALFSDGWVLLRPSGTEPLIRIFAEAKDPGRARALAEEGKRRVESALGEPPPPASR
ncbi:MAG: phosphoglucosamine mutase [Thermoplasmata archaeon]|nr:phosphoglucosamine mutase [Thermoplasmata archaeon]MCI4358938.1 phosphoglucosamine mutase [Thermoplasmata archaeon]